MPDTVMEPCANASSDFERSITVLLAVSIGLDVSSVRLYRL